MEASKRERIFLYGVVPIASVIIGAVATALATKYFGDNPAEDSLLKLLADPHLSPADRLKVLQALKEIDEPFWGTVRTFVGFLAVPIVWIGVAISQWIGRQ
ncbi:hypothetical protein [Novosphingobium lindaniclasticum]|uniref:hypothetical protein n=1 Tax=Novosphingobium lindaniclasticum TaxID=1329895 RepID=UPI001268CE7F|nr:hypothetical protein [Novosphingobium lindaniclasticum]